MALYFECRINKSALFWTALSAILPTGKRMVNDYIARVKVDWIVLSNGGKSIFSYLNTVSLIRKFGKFDMHEKLIC